MTRKKNEKSIVERQNEELENIKVEEGPRLPPAMYWEWRTTIEEQKTAQLYEKIQEYKRELLNREIENKKLRLSLFKEPLSSARISVQAAKKEYEAMKERIEKEIGMSLNGCVISDMTDEVKKVEE